MWNEEGVFKAVMLTTCDWRKVYHSYQPIQIFWNPSKILLFQKSEICLGNQNFLQLLLFVIFTCYLLDGATTYIIEIAHDYWGWCNQKAEEIKNAGCGSSERTVLPDVWWICFHWIVLGIKFEAQFYSIFKLILYYYFFFPKLS